MGYIHKMLITKTKVYYKDKSTNGASSPFWMYRNASPLFPCFSSYLLTDKVPPATDL